MNLANTIGFYWLFFGTIALLVGAILLGKYVF